MMDARTRYQNDPQFHALVDTMVAMVERYQFTPTEIRDAAMLAAILFDQRTVRRHWFEMERRDKETKG